MLQGCGGEAHPASTPPPPAIVVERKPSADLLVCARRPAGLPEDEIAVMPRALRQSLAAIARAFGGNADQLDRLVQFNDPAAGCATPATSGEPAR